MTSSVQNEAIRLLAELWRLSPDIRLGQLLAHLGFMGEVHLEKGLGYIDDDELIAVMYRHKAELEARLPSAANMSPEPSALSVSGSSTLPQSPAAEI
jgi:hypothetical protein